jgi:hypothetical protein
VGELLPGELLQLIAQHLNPAELDDLAVEQRHDFGGNTVYSIPMIRTASSIAGREQRASGQHDKYGSALAAHLGES